MAWGLEAVVWRLVAGFGRSGGSQGDIMRGIHGSGSGSWASWGEVGGGYGSLLTLHLTAWSLPSKEGAGGLDGVRYCSILLNIIRYCEKI